MRTIEYLAKLYPEKTGKELFAIQEQDKEFDKLESKKNNKRKLDLIKDYNKNGAYFKSTFGLDQYRYDRFFNMRLDSSNKIMCDVETIVGFYKGQTTPNNEMLLERKYKEYQAFNKYLLQEENRISREEYESLSNHIDAIFSDFWGLIDKSQFK